MMTWNPRRRGSPQFIACAAACARHKPCCRCRFASRGESLRSRSVRLTWPSERDARPNSPRAPKPLIQKGFVSRKPIRPKTACHQTSGCSPWLRTGSHQGPVGRCAARFASPEATPVLGPSSPIGEWRAISSRGRRRPEAAPRRAAGRARERAPPCSRITSGRQERRYTASAERRGGPRPRPRASVSSRAAEAL